MKILIVTVNYYPNVNGSSVFTQRLAHYLKQRGHDILVMAQSKTLRHEPFEHNKIEVFGIGSIPASFIYKGFRYPIGLGIKNVVRREIKKFQPDIIHIQDHFVIGPVVAKVAKELKIPVVGTNHFMPENLVHYLHLPKPLEEGIKNMAWGQFRRVYNDLSAITTPTKTAAALLKHIKLDREVIPLSNGIDLTRFKPTNDGEYLRQRYNVPKVPTLLYVGRLDREKNLDFIISCLPEVLKKTKMQFVIGGKGQMHEKLKKMVHNLGLESNVIFAGYVPEEDLGNFYTLANCFVMAGIAELQSIVTMEAMATGLPVVAVDAVALPELVHNGENGFLFKEGNKHEFTEAVVKIFNEATLRKKMGEKSLEIIKAHDINVIIGKFEEIYQGVKGKA